MKVSESDFPTSGSEIDFIALRGGAIVRLAIHKVEEGLFHLYAERFHPVNIETVAVGSLPYVVSAYRDISADAVYVHDEDEQEEITDETAQFLADCDTVKKIADNLRDDAKKTLEDMGFGGN